MVHRGRPRRFVSGFFVDAPEHFGREGFYDTTDGGAFEDNPLCFAAVTHFALRAAPLVLGATLDVVHANDWQTGLAPVYGKRGEAHTLAGALARAATMFREDRRTWGALQQRGMRRDSNRARSAAAYLELYRVA